MAVSMEKLPTRPMKHVRFNNPSHVENIVVSSSTPMKKQIIYGSHPQQNCFDINLWKRKLKLNITVQEYEKTARSLQAEKSVLLQKIEELRDTDASDSRNANSEIKDSANGFSTVLNKNKKIHTMKKIHRGRPNSLRHHRYSQQQEKTTTSQCRSVNSVTEIGKSNSEDRVNPQPIEKGGQPIMKPYKCEEEYEKLIREVRELKQKPMKKNKISETLRPRHEPISFLRREKEEYEKLIREVRQLKQKLRERNSSSKKSQPSLPQDRVSFLAKEKEEYEKLIREVRQLKEKSTKASKRTEKPASSPLPEILEYRSNENEAVNGTNDGEHVAPREAGEIEYVIERVDLGEGEIIGEIEDDNGEIIGEIDEDSIEVDFETEPGKHKFNVEYLDLELIDG